MPGNLNLPSTGERVPVNILVLEVVLVAAVRSRAACGPPEEAFLLQAATAPKIIPHFEAPFEANIVWFCSRAAGSYLGRAQESVRADLDTPSLVWILLGYRTNSGAPSNNIPWRGNRDATGDFHHFDRSRADRGSSAGSVRLLFMHIS